MTDANMTVESRSAARTAVWGILLVCVVMAGIHSPRHALGQVNRAKALEYYAQGGLYDAQNDPANAIKSYLQALEYDPTSADIHTALAVDYYRVNQRDDAQQHARKAVELDSTATDAWIVLGKYNADLGRYVPARAAF